MSVFNYVMARKAKKQVILSKAEDLDDGSNTILAVLETGYLNHPIVIN